MHMLMTFKLTLQESNFLTHLVVEVLDEDEEILEAPLFEHAHEVGGESLTLIRRYLAHLTTLAHNITSLNALKLQISGHARMDEQLDQLTVGHDELGDEVDVPIATAAVGGFVRLWHTELLEELVQRCQRCGFAAVVLVPVHMQDLLAGHGQHAGKDALSEAGAQDHAIIFFIHDELREV